MSAQAMNPTSNVDFSHDAYMKEFKNQNFQGYKNHMAYLDYFVKTDVSKRDGNQTIATTQPAPKKEEVKKVPPKAGEEEVKEAPQLQHTVQAQNKPLIIAGDEGCGKTALISHWLNHSALFNSRHCKHQILLVHVAGASSCERKYQSFIHRALVKLRKSYPDVQTGLVNIIDDKLRINFSRSLDLVSNAIGQSSGGGGGGATEGTERESGSTGVRDNQSRIIMILDGPENFRDSDNDQGVDSEQSADWVPWSFPDRFRVIILTRKRSKAMNHFKLRKCPLLYMGEQLHFNSSEINTIIDEHVTLWGPTLNPGSQDSFEGRLAIIKNELVVRRDQIYKDEQKAQRAQRELLSPEQLLVFRSLEDELNDGNFHLLARPADEWEAKFAKATERQLNPLVIRCILHYYLYCGSTQYTGPQTLRPLDMKIILSCKTLHQLFTTVIKHFRDCLFTNKRALSPPHSASVKSSTMDSKEKFDHLLAYICVSRKGITWRELKELIPSLTDEDIKLFQDIFGFLLIQYVPDNNTSSSGITIRETFIFYKHASFKKAVRETIECMKIDSSRAGLHKNLATLIEKYEPTNQFLWQRRVDELCFHYQMGGLWIKLKDLISSVEVFSTMFVVPDLRYELAQQWLWLLGAGSSGPQGGSGTQKSNKSQCDPVVEYNKSLESFIIKYRPTSKELFVIMIQLSRFFKEDLAELVSGAEASEPQFAHPPLLGTREMESIRLLKEIERLENLFTHDREQVDGILALKQPTSSSQLIASLRGFNIDNDIVREQIIDLIRKEMRAQNSAKEMGGLQMMDEETTTHYHYKRWLWVQFPWCTIDVHSDISNIMELFAGGGDASNYISATKENELSKATLQILHATKQRSLAMSGNDKQLNQSSNQSSTNISMKKKLKKQSSSPSKKKLMLPPVVPLSAKNANTTVDGTIDGTKASFSRTIIIGNRSISAGRIQRDKSPPAKLPMLIMDAMDRQLGASSNLAQFAVSMNDIEKDKMKEIESENVSLGAQLNQLNFMVYRQEKTQKQLEENYRVVMIEYSINLESQNTLEVMEAKLLHAYEDLNRAEVERKRIEQIVKACEKNNPNNDEQIRSLEQQIDVYVKLIGYYQGIMSTAHKEQELFKKQLQEMIIGMSKSDNERSTQFTKINEVMERQRRLQMLMIEGVEDRKNFALAPAEANDIDVGKLKQRQQLYRKWKAKLNVTRAFVSEKRNMYERSFLKMIEIAGLRKIDVSNLVTRENPLHNLEGLIAFIERANDLDKSKKQKEAKIEKLKRDQIELRAELKKWENGVQLIECGHIERAQKKLYLEDKSLRSCQDVQQRQMSLIADLKSGFVNVAKILGIQKGLDTESDQSGLIEKICERFGKLEASKNGSKVNFHSETLSGPHNNESNRSSAKNDENMIKSPQGQRLRKKQPNQKQPAADTISVKHSPSMIQNSTATAGMGGQQNEHNELEEDNEERLQMTFDRMRLKKTLTLGGNYALAKVSQPNQSGTPTANVSVMLGNTTKDDSKVRSTSLGAKPSMTSSLSTLKKNNITSSNPIIGAPLGPKKDMSGKKIVLPAINKKVILPPSGSQISKPAIASKAPKVVKSIKFATDVEAGDSQ